MTDLLKENFLLDDATVERWLGISGRLRDRHPRIVSPAEVAQASDQSTYTSNGIEYGFSDIDENRCDTVDCECTSRCNEEYRAASNDAGFKWFTDALLDARPFGFLIGWVEMGINIHDLGVARLDCLEQCEGIDFPNRCSRDVDCPSTQYCKHVFGNPYHMCSDKKAEGQSCSRHNKCASGCCKYRPFANPFAKVCRPASACN